MSVCISIRERMFLSKAVIAALFLIQIFNAIWAIPQPGVIRERHIIHAPIKFKIIHHHNIKKIPIIIKKHLHYYKPQEEISNHPNLIREDDSYERYNQFKFSQEESYPKFKIPFREDDYDIPEEDYEEGKQSQEEQYEDYEYE